MKKRFGELRVGEKFYPPLDDGKMDLFSQLIKVTAIRLTSDPPWEGIKFTPNVILHKGKFNSVIIQSANNESNGYYDSVPDDLMIYPENLMC